MKKQSSTTKKGVETTQEQVSQVIGKEDIAGTDSGSETAYFKEGGFTMVVSSEQNKVDTADLKNITELSTQNANELVEIDEGEFENEIDTEIRNEVEQMKCQGVFIPIDEFTLLCTVNNGSAIMAKKNLYKGNRSEVAIIYAHNDGSRSDEVLISNAELLAIARGNFGRDDDNAVLADKADIASAKKALKKFEEKLLPFWRFGINVSSCTIVQMICNSYNRLKEDRSALPDIYNIYSYIIKKVEEDRNHPAYTCLIRKQFYALPENYFAEIALHFNLNTKELAVMLKQANLLYTQDSSVGYQCKVKDCGYCYCVRMPKSRMGKFEPVDLSSISL